MNKAVKYISIFIFASAGVYAQSVRSLNNDGVDLYRSGKYSDAEVNFKKGIEKDSNNYHARFNLGNAYYKQGKYDEAIKAYTNSVPKAVEKSAECKIVL